MRKFPTPRASGVARPRRAQAVKLSISCLWFRCDAFSGRFDANHAQSNKPDKHHRPGGGFRYDIRAKPLFAVPIRQPFRDHDPAGERTSRSSAETPGNPVARFDGDRLRARRRDVQRATGQSPNTSCFTSARAAFETKKAVVAQTERHQPAEPSALATVPTVSKNSARPASNVRTGDQHREQVGVEQRLRCAVGQTSRQLGFPRLSADEVIERLGPLWRRSRDLHPPLPAAGGRSALQSVINSPKGSQRSPPNLASRNCRLTR
jgi:hypothetical protein